jgi:dipeptidyl aminopeptidase/acylaminoacyl peptidase
MSRGTFIMRTNGCGLLVKVASLVMALILTSTACRASKALSTCSTSTHQLTLGTQRVSSISYSPDGTILAAGGQDKLVRMWDTRTWKVLHDLPHPGGVMQVTFSASGKVLATAFDTSFENNTSYVWLWDVGTGKKLGAYAESKHIITSIAFCPNGKLLAVGLNSGIVRLLDIESPSAVKTVNEALVSFDSGISSLSFSPDSRRLAASTYKGMSGPKDTGKVKILDVQTGNEVHVYSRLGNVFDLAFSPNGQLLAVAGVKINELGEGRREPQLSLVILNTQNWKQVEFLEDHPVGAGLAFSTDGLLLLSAYPSPPQAAVVVWSMQKKQITRSINDVNSVASFASNSMSIAVGDEAGRIHLYSIAQLA